MNQFVAFLLCMVVCQCSFALQRDDDTINRLNKAGKRVGYWIMTEDNQPITAGSPLKRKEGRYVNGRRNGAWIYYFSDAKTIRLIGEFVDNRPGGAYFRFDKKGEITQASSVIRKISSKQHYETFNNMFACRLMFHNREMVAGQVFFKPKVFEVPYAYNFWMEEKIEESRQVASEVNFSWLNGNYAQLYANYLKVRTPKKHLEENTSIKEVARKINKLNEEENRNPSPTNVITPPVVVDPRVARGLIFQPNGFNKLYTRSDEIWIDGYFRNGQLKDGKVFLYDHDGVLLKVRVYKDGKYVSDGGL